MLLTEATIEAGQKLTSAKNQISDEIDAKECAERAYRLEEFLALIGEMTTGKKRDSGDEFEYYDLAITVPKPTQLKHEDE